MPDSYVPNLVPKIISKHGEEYMPVAYVNNVNHKREGESVVVMFSQDLLCKVVDVKDLGKNNLDVTDIIRTSVTIMYKAI